MLGITNSGFTAHKTTQRKYRHVTKVFYTHCYRSDSILYTCKHRCWLDDIQSRLTYSRYFSVNSFIRLCTLYRFIAYIARREKKLLSFNFKIFLLISRQCRHKEREKPSSQFQISKVVSFHFTKAVVPHLLSSRRKSMANVIQIQLRWMYCANENPTHLPERAKKRKFYSVGWTSWTRCHDPFSPNKCQIDGKSAVADLVHNVRVLSFATSIYFYSWFLFISFVTKDRENCGVSHVEALASQHPYVKWSK